MKTGRKKYPGFKVKMKNRRITLTRYGDCYAIQCKMLTGEKKIRRTNISFSHEAMQNLMFMWLLLEQQSGNLYSFSGDRPMRVEGVGNI